MLQLSANDAVGVEHVGHAAAHAGREITAGAAQHDDAAAGHVFAAVIADALDDGLRAAVANGEPLAGDAAHERVAAGGAVERDVADDDVFFRGKRGVARRTDDEASAGQSLADEVVGLAFERQCDAAGKKRAEALTRRTGEVARGWCRRAGPRRRSAW